jgi:hypothetical protein
MKRNEPVADLDPFWTHRWSPNSRIWHTRHAGTTFGYESKLCRRFLDKDRSHSVPATRIASQRLSPQLVLRVNVYPRNFRVISVMLSQSANVGQEGGHATSPEVH